MTTPTIPRAFISFDFDHNETEKHLFAGQAKNSRTPFTLADWSSKSHLPQAQWEDLIGAKIAQTNLLIVLVGPYTAAATGVLKEIAMAKSYRVPHFGVRVGGADWQTALPAGLPQHRVVDWDWNAIAGAVAQCMGEGKNAR